MKITTAYVSGERPFVGRFLFILIIALSILDFFLNWAYLILFTLSPRTGKGVLFLIDLNLNGVVVL